MPYGDEKSYSFFKMKGHTLPGPFQKNGEGFKPNPNVPPPGTETKTKEIKETKSQEELIKKFKENIPTPEQRGYPGGAIEKIIKTDPEKFIKRL